MMFLALERVRLNAMSDKDGKGHPIMFSAVLMILCIAFLSAAEHAANHTEMQYERMLSMVDV
jgi:hypothetical protein